MNLRNGYMRVFGASVMCRVLSVVCGVAQLSLGVTADEPTIVTPAYNTLTDQQEISLGKEAAAAIGDSQRLRFVAAPRVQTYVDGLIQKVARASRRATLP